MSDFYRGESEPFSDYNYDGDYNERDDELEEFKNEKWRILEQSELFGNRSERIAEIQELLSFTYEQATLACVYFNWDTEAIRDTWFNDPNLIYNAGIELSPESLKQTLAAGGEQNTEECLVCYEDLTNGCVSLSCKHNFCKDCFGEHVKVKCEDWLTSISSTCPQKGCNVIIPEKVFYAFLNEQQLTQYNKCLLKNFTESNTDIEMCPNEKCQVIVQSFSYITDITCTCGKIWCFKCKKDTHRPTSCEMMENWAKRSVNSDDIDKWIAANCKTCPHCKQKIQKSSGCNYMLCNKQAGGCGEAFCYVCEVDWKLHSQDHFNCNKYTEEVKNKEKEAEKLKAEVEKLEFYFKRFMTYKASVKSTLKLSSEIDRIIDIIIKEFGIDYDELSFLYALLNSIKESKEILSNTYVLGFYLNSKKKDLFEYQQGLLEKNSESLHEKLEFQFIQNLMGIKSLQAFTKEFYRLKEETLNLKSSTEKYALNIIEMIENEMISDIDFTMLTRV